MNYQKEIALAKLTCPVIPLARLIQLLFLTGPFTKVEEVLAELKEPIETSACRYEDPQSVMAPYMDIIQEFQHLKTNLPTDYKILDEQNQPLDSMEALDLWVSQQILARELEEINSLLCGLQHCILCCTGPTVDNDQYFFEIPLSAKETAQFDLPRFDSAASRAQDSCSIPALGVAGRPFYEQSNPAIYHWHTGWSLILPRGKSCSHLAQDGRCAIYQQRPAVCRRPQIFPYMLEAESSNDQQPSNHKVYIARKKLLAIWDCPYVKEFQDRIAAYAELCGLEPIFKENKA